MSVGARKETFMSQEGQLHAEGMVTNVMNAALHLRGRPCGLRNETRASSSDGARALNCFKSSEGFHFECKISLCPDKDVGVIKSILRISL